MPSRWVALLGVAATCLGRQARAQQPTLADARGFLHSYIDPQIVDEGGLRAPSSARLVRPVDANGAIHLQFRHDTLRVFQPVRPALASDTAARRLTLALLTDLESYGRVADSLTRSVAQGGAAFQAAATRARQWYKGYTGDVVEYFTLRAKREQPEREAHLAAAGLAQPYLEDMPGFVALLQQDVQRLVREAAAATPDYGTLRIAALRITPKGDTIQVKVPGYDTTAERSPTVIRKITTEMTPPERAANEYARNASAKVKNVGDLAAYAFSDYAELVADARSSARDLVEALAAAADSLRVSSGRSMMLSVVPPDAQQAARLVEGDVRTTLSWLRALVDTSRALQVALNAALDARRDPLAFLDAIARAFSSATAARALLARGVPLADSLSAHLEAFALVTPSLDVLAAGAVATAPLNRIVAAYERLQRVASGAGMLLSFGKNLPDLAAAFSDDEIRRLKLVPQPVATAPESDILLVQAGGDRAEGDLLKLHADLIAPAGARLASYEWYFQIEKLGWSSRFAAGIGFAASTTAASDHPLRPIPVLGWVLRYRTRGESRAQQFFNFLDPSPGLHTVTLSTDAQAIQLGVGASLNLLHDFLQVGVGRKLQPADRSDRYYWYFGLGLFKLANLGK